MISKSKRLNKVGAAGCNRFEKAGRTTNAGKGKKAFSLNVCCTVRVGNKAAGDNLNAISKPCGQACLILTIYDGKRELCNSG